MNHDVADFVKSLFPGQFLIPVSSFAKLVGKSVGGARNKICQGSFPLPVVRQGGRNYVAALEVIKYLSALANRDEVENPPTPTVSASAAEEKPARYSKYGEAAKARAAAARAARAAKRALAVREGGAA